MFVVAQKQCKIKIKLEARNNTWNRDNNNTNDKKLLWIEHK